METRGASSRSLLFTPTTETTLRYRKLFFLALGYRSLAFLASLPDASTRTLLAAIITEVRQSRHRLASGMRRNNLTEP